MKAVSSNLRSLREARGLTQNELGSRAGIAPASISHFETGQRTPSLESLLKLAEALSVSTDALLGRVGAALDGGAHLDPIFVRASQADAQTLDTIKRITATLLADAGNSDR